MTARVFKVILSYDGTNYVGWQVQCNGLAIQQVVETVLARVLGERVRVTASGRTDSGVHALAQVASFAANTEMSAERLARAMNGNLPDDIRVRSVEDAPFTFHAIRDARWKRYRYVLRDGPIPDVFARLHSWHVRYPLDVPAMSIAAEALLGRHDFASFQAANSPRATTVRTIHELRVMRTATIPDEIWIEVTADGFLYNMVRNIVGSLVLIGRGERTSDWLRDVLAGRDRRLAGPTAPPLGLFLDQVGYEAWKGGDGRADAQVSGA